MRDADRSAARPGDGGGAKVAVVFNPSTGGELAAARREAVQAALAASGLDWTWLETTAQDAGGGLVDQALTGGAGLVVACGGDGTIRACAAALAGTDVPLAVLPAGTGNLVAANFDLPDGVEDALAVALGGTRRRIDLGVITVDGKPAGGDRFIVMAGFGIDAAMVRDARPRLKSRLGVLAYVLSGLRNLRRPRSRVWIRLDDGAPVRHRVQGMLVGNLGRLPGGVTVLPDAVCDDGLLDAAVIKARRWPDWAGVVARALIRRPQDRRMVEYFQSRRVEIACDRPQPVEQDGELLPRGRRLVVEVLPAAVSLIVPDRST